MDRRDEFLVEMYRQTSNHLNRHIMASWQFVTVLIGAFAVIAVVEKAVLIDFACAIVVVLCGWLSANVLDSSNWFNRNITIVSNIERQFLLKKDLQEIHPFFGGHRNPRSMITYFWIQLLLSLALAILILGYHFYKQVQPGFACKNCSFDPVRALPYVAALVCAGGCIYLWNKHKRDDKKLQKNSPGCSVI